jgi:hypothetical protein
MYNVGQLDVEEYWNICKHAERWDVITMSDEGFSVKCGFEWWQEYVVNKCFWGCSIFDCSKENFVKYMNTPHEYFLCHKRE